MFFILRIIRPRDNKLINFLSGRKIQLSPWDYRSAEIGYNKMSYTTFFINIFAKLGLDLKFKISIYRFDKRNCTEHSAADGPGCFSAWPRMRLQ
jgi:hypothetical protein